MLFILEILAPISRRGSMIRPIGREFKDVSPERVVVKFCPARIPEIKRVVVPLFPVFKVSEGAQRPRRPFPCTRIFSGVCSISIPIFRKQSMVERQSAPFKKLVISVVPFARAPNMTERWEMDLSPGILISPRNGCVFLIMLVVFISLFSIYRSYTI